MNKQLLILNSGIVKRQALDDLDTDATHLVDVVEAQARRLGSENRIRNAMTLFGLVGENHEGSNSARCMDGDPSGHPNRQRVTQRSLVYMILENVVSIGKSALSTIAMSIVAILSTVFGIISIHRIILGLLVISAAANILLTSRSTLTYWAERSASRFLYEVGVKPNKMMSKAIYLRDMEDLVWNGTELAIIPKSEWYVRLGTFPMADVDT